MAQRGVAAEAFGAVVLGVCSDGEFTGDLAASKWWKRESVGIVGGGNCDCGSPFENPDRDKTVHSLRENLLE